MSSERRDTQWPRFEVFQQVREGAPFANVGSVHATDPEMAIQNARDVFVRRPQTNRLWVVPADTVLSRTAEELEAEPDWRREMVTEDVPDKQYYVFCKSSQRHAMTYVSHVGEITAPTPVQALARAMEKFADEQAYVWWIVAADAIVTSRDEDAESLFAPAHDKSYRMPGDFPTRTLMEQVTRKR